MQIGPFQNNTYDMCCNSGTVKKTRVFAVENAAEQSDSGEEVMCISLESGGEAVNTVNSQIDSKGPICQHTGKKATCCSAERRESEAVYQKYKLDFIKHQDNTCYQLQAREEKTGGKTVSTVNINVRAEQYPQPMVPWVNYVNHHSSQV